MGYGGSRGRPQPDRATGFCRRYADGTVVPYRGPLQYLPRCVLASIVYTIAVGMIDVTRLFDIRRESPGEFYITAFTAAAVVAIGVEQGILLAIALSLFRQVQPTHRYSRAKRQRPMGSYSC